MDFWTVVATVLWTSFGAALVAALVGVGLMQRGHRHGGLVLLLGSTLVLLAFSYAAGFSIGRFTAAIPVMLIGLMLASGRGAVFLVNALLGSAIVYFACSWGLSPLALQGDAFSWLLGAWAIPLYVVLALGAYVIAVYRPPRSPHRSSSRS